MATRNLRLNQKGYTLVELAVVTLVIAVMATTVITANNFANKQSVNNQDDTFATEKAIQMYEELRTLVNGNEQLGASVLDNYSNYSTYDLVLTTDKHVDTGLSTANPGDPLSGNIKTDGNWRYMRQVEVDLVANDTQARQVTVKVYKYPGDLAGQAKPGTLLATVGGILRTSALPNVPTQVFDLYILQVTTIPSWWSVLPTLAGYMQAAVSDLESRLQGVKLRVHYITRTSYGRDYYYKPESNSINAPADTTVQQWVYYYPGQTPQDGTAGEAWYYDATSFGDPNSLMMAGNFMVDGNSYPVSITQFNNLAGGSYSVADQYNNAMRYPDELAAYQAVTAAAAAVTAVGGIIQEGTTEISERMLIEGMLSQPASFANAMIVNLHGELLPLPPLRNYSDAAKDPGNQLAHAVSFGTQGLCPVTVNASNVTFTGDQGVRVVTHPELLYYPGATATSSSVTVRLRVYAYYDTEDVGGSAGLPSGDPRVPAISIFFPDAGAAVIGVTAIIGNGSTLSYSYSSPAGPYSSGYSSNIPGDTAVSQMGISIQTYNSNNQTLITLLNTPLRAAQMAVSPSGTPTKTATPVHTPKPTSPTFTPTQTFTATPTPAAVMTGGLNSGDMLYGSEYIPGSPDLTTSTTNLTALSYAANNYSFTYSDLTSTATGPGNPKNTARWIISVVMPVSQVFPGGVTNYNTNTNGPITISGCHAIETYLGAGITTMPYSAIAGVTTPIYPDLSRTYVWCGDAFMPPYTEQYQLLGDPRDCPYLDVKVGGVSIIGAAVTIGPNAYNWWFKGSGTGNMAADGYAGFGQAGSNSFNMTGTSNAPNYVNVDLPRYYQLIRQGLLKTTSIWTGTNGWSWYYYGLGGEYGSDEGPRSNGVCMVSNLFVTSGGGAVTGFNDLSVWNGSGAAVWGKGSVVVSNIKGSSSVTWYQRSWLGELYPDTSYGNWVTYGNLPSNANTTAASKPESFYLEPMESVQTTGANGSDDGFAGVTFIPNPGGNGGAAFYNGESTSTGNYFEHQGPANPYIGNELSLAITTYNIYPFPLPGVIDIQRDWDFNGGSAPNMTTSPYNSAGMTTTSWIPSVTNHNGSEGTTSRLFYDSGSAGTGEYGAGVIALQQVNNGTTQVGYVVENGSAPSTAVGAQSLAETSLVLALRTFLDGGQMAVTNAVGHIVQLPLVKIFLAQAVPQYNASQSISFTVACPVTATTAGGGAVSVGMPVTDIWWAYNPNGLANYYTEEYPHYGAAMTGTGMYQEAATVVYNLKFNVGGTNWYYVQDGTAAVTGVCDCNLSGAHAVTTAAPWGYSWPVATGGIGGATLPEGPVQLAVEAYRYNYGLHYCYDLQNIIVSY